MGAIIPLIIEIITPIIYGCQLEVIFLIVYDKLWETMKKKGFNTYILREKCFFDSKTIRRLKGNLNVETKTLNQLCVILSCSLEDIAEYRADEAK